MVRWTRLGGIVGLAAALALGSATIAPQQASASCLRRYWVYQQPAPVRENPNSHSKTVKYKRIFDTVTGPCWKKVPDKYSARRYVAVHTSAASDGVGWMSTNYVKRL